MKLQKYLLSFLAISMIALGGIFFTGINKVHANGYNFYVEEIDQDSYNALSINTHRYVNEIYLSIYNNQIWLGDDNLTAHVNQSVGVAVSYLIQGVNFIVEEIDQDSYNALSINKSTSISEIYLSIYNNQIWLGDYNLTAHVNQFVGVAVSYLIQANVSIPDNVEPVISGQTTFVTNVDNQRNVSYFLDQLSAYDETDGVVPVYIVTDNYTANKSKLGIHTIIIGAKDLSNNETTATINVQVVDITPPTITSSTTQVNQSYTSKYNLESFKTSLTVNDNHSSLSSADITIKTDGYTSNYNKLGTYNVVYEVKDVSGNAGTFTLKVKVIDDVKPTFSGPDTITTNNNTILTEADVRAQLTANDAIDGNITSKIVLVEDNYTGKGNKFGTYTIKYSVTDNAGNKAERTVNIVREDKIPPTIWVLNGSSIRTTPETPLTHEQIIDILTATGEIQVTTTTQVNFLLDEYSGNEDNVGTYGMVIQARSSNGNSNTVEFSITVLASEDEGITVNPATDWLKDNYVYLIIGVIAISGLAYIAFRRR